LDCASQWLTDCLTTHSKCKKPERYARLPTRVIDVSAPESISGIRLVGATESFVNVPYASLSHCWGALPVIKLLSSNVLSFENSIPLDSLSKSFRDAILATRHLGLRYLWIDSLCIVQDSLKDWEFESAMMSEIYENACVNIAATAATDGSFGCFNERRPLLVQQCGVDMVLDPSMRTVQCVISQRGLWRRDLDDAPLNTRAWVAQERFASPRIIHFARHQIFWECKELAGNLLC
jgi:hypothetical protein